MVHSSGWLYFLFVLRTPPLYSYTAAPHTHRRFRDDSHAATPCFYFTHTAHRCLPVACLRTALFFPAHPPRTAAPATRFCRALPCASPPLPHTPATAAPPLPRFTVRSLPTITPHYISPACLTHTHHAHYVTFALDFTGVFAHVTACAGYADYTRTPRHLRIHLTTHTHCCHLLPVRLPHLRLDR